MAGADLKGVHIVARRQPGKPVRWYVYAWRGGPQIMATTGGPRPALDAAALEQLLEARQDARQQPAGTFAALATEWRASAAWAALAPATRKIWGLTLATVQAKFGPVPLAVFEDRRVKGKIVAWRDTMAATPRKADYHIQVLRALLAYGRLTGQLAVNMAADIPQLYKGGNRAAIIWEPAEVDAWQAAGQSVRDAVNLARLTGLRRADLVELPQAAIKAHAIVWQTSKSGRARTVSVPILPALRTLLDDLATRPRQPSVETALVNSLGKAWTPGGLTASFTQERIRLALADKHLHDFRGTYVTELCLAGLTDQEIAGIAGWAPSGVAEIRRLYVDQARTVVAMGERLANSAVKQPVKQSRNKPPSR